MKRRNAISIIAIALLGLGSLFAASAAIARQKPLKDKLVGTWAFVSAVNTMPDGRKIEPNGKAATGILMFDAAGHFSWQIIRSDIPKLASNNRQTGTPEENKAVAQGVLAYFGTYSIDDTGKSLTMQIATSSFPNFNGANQKRSVTLSGDELTITNQAGASGGIAAVKWKRMK